MKSVGVAWKSASFHNVCARAALTESSANKKQLQGTIVMKGNLILTYFCVVAWEMEGINIMIDLINIFHFAFN